MLVISTFSQVQDKMFYNEQFLNKINNIPGKTWTAGIPERFKDHSRR